MKDEATVSRLPDEWGGPFMWFRNDRGNLELIAIAKVTDALREASEAIRAHLARVQS